LDDEHGSRYGQIELPNAVPAAKYSGSDAARLPGAAGGKWQPDARLAVIFRISSIGSK
jgi:hypothetical protein